MRKVIGRPTGHKCGFNYVFHYVAKPLWYQKAVIDHNLMQSKILVFHSAETRAQLNKLGEVTVIQTTMAADGDGIYLAFDWVKKGLDCIAAIARNSS
jgi:hypothetical protein